MDGPSGAPAVVMRRMDERLNDRASGWLATAAAMPGTSVKHVILCCWTIESEPSGSDPGMM